MKAILLILMLPLACGAQSALDSANGFKSFKLGTHINNNKSQVTGSILQDDGSTLWLIEAPELLTVGDIKISNAGVTTYNDTVRQIVLLLEGLNGIALAQAFIDRYGFPNKENKSILDGYEWQTEKINLKISGSRSSYRAFYKDVRFEKQMLAEAKKRNLDGL